MHFCLIPDEKSEAFDWTFECMKECFEEAPINIITNECPSYKKAIETKFPNSEHFICSWHKSQNIKKHLGQNGCFMKKKSKKFYEIKLNLIGLNEENDRKNYEQLLSGLRNFPYCLSTEKAEEILSQVKTHKFLKEVVYFQQLSEDKKKWCSAYRKEFFTLRARTTQRVEKMDSMIKK